MGAWLGLFMRHKQRGDFEMPSLPDEEIMKLRPMCNCCKKRLTRVILPHTPWNESGQYLFHCLISGRVTPIRDIEYVIRTGRQEPEVEEAVETQSEPTER